MPKYINDYCDFYDITHNDEIGRFFKAVHKRDNEYFSDYDSSFKYIIGEKVTIDDFDTNPNIKCGSGIYLSNLNYAVNYGRHWHDIAIIEVEVELKNVVVPKYNNGKIRCSECTVIREVPLEECGLLGKIIAKNRNHTFSY